MNVDSPFRRVLAEFAESRVAVVALALLIVIIAVGVLAPVISPQNPYDLTEIEISDSRLSPGSAKYEDPPRRVLRARLNLPAEGAGSPEVTDTILAGDEYLTGLSFRLEAFANRSYRVIFDDHPDLTADRVASVQLRQLPAGVTVPVGQKREFRREWTLTFDDLMNLTFTLPENARARQRIEFQFNGTTGDKVFTFWLGSDGQGRDMMSAIFFGLRISVTLALSSVLIASLLGCIAGLAAAYYGGTVSAIVMRLIDLILSFPGILIAMMLLAVLGKGVGNVILAIVLAQWPLYARLVRGVALAEVQKEYVEAAKCLGLSSRRIMFGEIAANCMPSLIVLATLQIASAITLEATLSFLGLGLPVTEPSLGSLISSGFEYLLSGEPWISVLPGVALLLTVACINLVGDQLRDVLNPRLKR